MQLDPEERTAIVSTWELPEVDLTGMSLPFLDGHSQAYHVWMVIEPDWVWRRILFQAQDGIAERRRAEDGKQYRVSRRATKDELVENLPTNQSPQVVVSKGVVKDGWDHEHCELCWATILPEHLGYRDESNHWVCESCHSAFVSTHDLSFLNDYWPQVF